MKEKSIVNRILAYLKTRPDCFCWKEHGDGYSRAGLPDIICCIGGRFVAFEVKAPGRKPTVLQDKTLSRIQNVGGIAHVVISLDEVKTILNGLGLECGEGVAHRG